MNSPFTREQQMFATSVKRCADGLDNLSESLNSKKQIDWEQRRYEIARDILAVQFSASSMGYSVENAVRVADKLIEELKRK